MPDKALDKSGILAAQSALWLHWGFEPWQQGPFSGVARRQHFVKDGFLGRIAEYAAWDYIIWNCGTEDDRDELWRAVKPLPEIMTQRYLFVCPQPWPGRRIRSFCLGFKGYLEFYAYWPDKNQKPDKNRPSDLTGLVDLAFREHEKKQ